MTEASARSESSDAAPCQIHVGAFDGPLDLLLHLVRVNEVDLTDIPIIEIARQYDAYLEMMRELNLEVAGEYLVMAATLVHIKSRLLLPPDPESAEEAASEDPRDELAQQLVEYQRFKQAAEGLQALESRRSLIWTRDAVVDEFAGEELLAVDMFDLLRAFRKLLGRLSDEARVQLRRDTVSVAEKISWLTDLLRERKSVSLNELLPLLPTRLDCIATFLAVLEMVRLRLLTAFQRYALDEIRLVLIDEPVADTAAGEFDGDAMEEFVAGSAEEEE